MTVIQFEMSRKRTPQIVFTRPFLKTRWKFIKEDNQQKESGKEGNASYIN